MAACHPIQHPQQREATILQACRSLLAALCAPPTTPSMNPLSTSNRVVEIESETIKSIGGLYHIHSSHPSSSTTTAILGGEGSSGGVEGVSSDVVKVIQGLHQAVVRALGGGSENGSAQHHVYKLQDKIVHTPVVVKSPPSCSSSPSGVGGGVFARMTHLASQSNTNGPVFTYTTNSGSPVASSSSYSSLYSPHYHPCGLVEYVWDAHAASTTIGSRRSTAPLSQEDVDSIMTCGQFARAIYQQLTCTSPVDPTRNNGDVDATFPPAAAHLLHLSTVEEAARAYIEAVLIFKQTLRDDLVGCYYSFGTPASASEADAPTATNIAVSTLMKGVPILSVIEGGILSGAVVLPPTKAWRDINDDHDTTTPSSASTSSSTCDLVATAILTSILCLTTSSPSTASKGSSDLMDDLLSCLGGGGGNRSSTGIATNAERDRTYNKPLTPTTEMLAEVKATARTATRIRSVLTAKHVAEKHLGRKAYNGMVRAVFAHNRNPSENDEEGDDEGGGSSNHASINNNRSDVNAGGTTSRDDLNLGEKRPRSEEGGDEGEDVLPPDHFPTLMPTSSLKPHRLAKELYTSKQHLNRAQNATSVAQGRVRDILHELQDALLDVDGALRAQVSAEKAHLIALRRNKIEHCAIREVFEIFEKACPEDSD